MTEKKILVVDDDETILEVYSESFSMEGYDVRTASSGEEALEILRRERIHVMFLDLVLPGMNGIELCKQIRKDEKFAIIHAVTGHASVFQLGECREAGFDDYFIKPFNINELVETARNAFKKIARWKGSY